MNSYQTSASSIIEKIDTNSLKVGSLVMIRGYPCKVTEAYKAKAGKMGAAKVVVKGKDILTEKVYECSFRASDMVDAPIVKR